jgi:hypothetical protein
MGLVSGLKGLLGKHSRDTKNEVPSSDTNTEKQRCLVSCKLRKAQYDAFAMLYYRGATSYRTFYRTVFIRKTTQLKKVMQDAEKKSKSGCDIDNTYVRFYKDKMNYIDIPFDDFSEKKDMRLNRRNTKLWNKNNILRLLRQNPKLRNLDDKMLREATIALINELLFEETK